MAPRWAAQTRRNGFADDERPEELRAALLTVAPFGGHSVAFTAQCRYTKPSGKRCVCKYQDNYVKLNVSGAFLVIV